jgi:DNA helicase-2/ATP-dependent DNA helicase PcrA
MTQVQLDECQEAVAFAPPEERLVVLAGAGRGKTEVVAARLAYLQSEYGLYEVDEILVLSFSRAAVRAVQRRVAGTSAAAVAVLTFDSFASRVLLEGGEDPSEYRGFDARIRAATDMLLHERSTYPGLLRHVILDEVQDLVGDRADFALALLRAVDDGCGFTALGDPLQAIYDWQLADSRSKTESSTLLEGLKQLGGRVVELSKDYRARGADPRKVVRLGDRLRKVNSGSEARALIDQFRDTLIDLGVLKDSADLVPGADHTVILCRTNADALLASASLRGAGIHHVLRRALEDVGTAPWLAEAFANVTHDVVEEDEVRDLLRRSALPIDIDEAWVALKTAEGDARSHATLRLDFLRRAMRSNAVPLDLRMPDDADVVVSTIHRAKGLEFDRVVLVDARWSNDEEDDWGVARLDYVALSRARDDIVRCSISGPQIRREKRSGRFTARTRRNWHYSWAMEAESSDVETSRPVVDATGSARGVQERLAQPDVVGTTLYADLVNRSPVDAPRYTLHLKDGQPVGRTSEQFGVDLVRVFGRRKPGESWPRRIEDIVLGAIEAVAGDPETTHDAELGRSGIWLVPRIVGMARPDWGTVEG